MQERSLTIPRIIHRIWLGPKPMPDEHVYFGETWQRHHPDWRMILWTDANLPEMVNGTQYDAAGLVTRSDILRYEVLAAYGGIYVDTDVECCRNFEPLVRNIDAFAGYEDSTYLCTAVMGSTKGHPWMRWLVSQLAAHFHQFPQDRAYRTEQTGPKFLTVKTHEFAKSNFPGPALLPPQYFYPYHWSEPRRHAREFPDAFAVHHWAKSWHAPNYSQVPLAQRPSSAGPLLYLANIAKLRTFMFNGPLSFLNAVARQPDTILFDPTSQGRSTPMPVEEAIAISCGGKRPRCVIHGNDLGTTGIPLVTGMAELKVPTVLELHDTWASPAKQYRFIRENGFDAAFMPYANYLSEYKQHCPGVKLFWHPLAVDTSLFCPWHSEKIYDLCLYGRLDYYYPFRVRLASLLQQCTDLRVRMILHPGYWDIGERAPGPHFVGQDLSKEISRSWITITTCGRQQGLFFKYFEIAASNSLIAGNMPDYGRSIFQNDFLELHEEQSDSDILSAIRSALSDKARIQSIFHRLGEKVRSLHSTEASAGRLVKFVDENLVGRAIDKSQPEWLRHESTLQGVATIDRQPLWDDTRSTWTG